ncbi:MAG: hypothetical protein ACI4RF_05930 [Eubacterium sp.]
MKTMTIMVNGIPEIFNDRYIINHEKGLVHSNPTEEQLRDCGYKEYIKSENTLDEKEGFYITTVYTETDEQIIEDYEYVEIVDEPVDDTEGITEDITDENI